MGDSWDHSEACNFTSMSERMDKFKSVRRRICTRIHFWLCQIKERVLAFQNKAMYQLQQHLFYKQPHFVHVLLHTYKQTAAWRDILQQMRLWSEWWWWNPIIQSALLPTFQPKNYSHFMSTRPSFLATAFLLDLTYSTACVCKKYFACPIDVRENVWALFSGFEKIPPFRGQLTRASFIFSISFSWRKSQ